MKQYGEGHGVNFLQNYRMKRRENEDRRAWPEPSRHILMEGYKEDTPPASSLATCSSEVFEHDTYIHELSRH